MLDRMVVASGLTKQDYITSCLLEHEIIVIPNSRTYKGLYDEMWRVYRELRRIRKAGALSQDLEDVLVVLSKEFVGLKDEPSDVEKEEAAITALKRGWRPRRSGCRESLEKMPDIRVLPVYH